MHERTCFLQTFVRASLTPMPLPPFGSALARFTRHVVDGAQRNAKTRGLHQGCVVSFESRLDEAIDDQLDDAVKMGAKRAATRIESRAEIDRASRCTIHRGLEAVEIPRCERSARLKDRRHQILGSRAHCRRALNEGLAHHRLPSPRNEELCARPSRESHGSTQQTLRTIL